VVSVFSDAPRLGSTPIDPEGTVKNHTARPNQGLVSARAAQEHP
jgi:hypothetical protein